MSDFRNPREFVRRAPQGTPTLRQFARFVRPRAAPAAVLPDPAGSSKTADLLADNEDQVHSLSDSVRSAEA